MITRLFTPDITHALGWTLVHALWQGALFALLLGGTLILLRRYSAQARYLVATGLFAGFFLTAVFTFTRLYTNATQTPDQPIALQVEQSPAPPGSEVTFTSPFAEAEESGKLPVATDQPTLRERSIAYYNEHLPLIVTIWMMGVFVLLLRLIGQLAYVQRLGAYATAAFPEEWQERIHELQMRMGIVRPVKSLLSTRVPSPLTYGFLRPVLLMPARVFQSLQENQIYAIIAHELAHIKRNDFLVNLLQRIMATLFFYHPGVWWMSARIEEEREHSCDDLAIQMTRHPVGYAKTLIQLEESQFYSPAVAMALKGKEKGSGTGFRQRINRLLSDSLGSGTFGEGLTTAFILVTVFLLAFATTGQSIDQLAKTDPLSQKEQKPTSEEIQRFEGDPDYDMDFDMDARVDVRSPDETGGPISSVPPISIQDTSKENMLYLFIEAIDDGNWRLVEYFLDRGVDVNGTNDREETPLMIAAGEHQPQIVRLLIERGADVNYLNADGRTALMYAAEEGADEAIRILIENGADPKLHGSDRGHNALHLAAGDGHTQVVKSMLDLGISPNTIDHEKATPLHYAASDGHEDVVKMLLDAGADPNSKDNGGRTPLHLAADDGHYGVVAMLLDNGVEPDQLDNNDRTPLMIAAGERHERVVDLLLKRGADPDRTDKDGRNAASYAANEGDAQSLKRLMKDTNPVGLDRTNILIEAADEGHLEIVKDMINSGTNVNGSNAEGITPLMAAADEGHLNVATYLIEQGADVDQRQSVNRPTALIYAADEGHEEIVSYLIAQGADLSVTHDFKNLDDLPGNPFNSNRSGDRPVLTFFRGADALMTAVEEEHPECVEALLKAGADPNRTSAKTRFVDIGGDRSWQEIYQISLSEARGTYEPAYDVRGWTPLMEAVESNEERIVRLLLKAGANVDAATNSGMTALTLARELGLNRLVNILEEAR